MRFLFFPVAIKDIVEIAWLKSVGSFTLSLSYKPITGGFWNEYGFRLWDSVRQESRLAKFLFLRIVLLIL